MQARQLPHIHPWPPQFHYQSPPHPMVDGRLRHQRTEAVDHGWDSNPVQPFQFPVRNQTANYGMIPEEYTLASRVRQDYLANQAPAQWVRRTNDWAPPALHAIDTNVSSTMESPYIGIEERPFEKPSFLSSPAADPRTPSTPRTMRSDITIEAPRTPRIRRASTAPPPSEIGSSRSGVSSGSFPGGYMRFCERFIFLCSRGFLLADSVLSRLGRAQSSRSVSRRAR